MFSEARGLLAGPTLRKWLPIALLIGVVAGLGAIVFFAAIQWVTQLFLGDLVGYLPPSPSGEGAAGIVPMARPWLLPVVVALGGLISGLIVFTWAPEAEGHGTDAAIDAFHHHEGYIRPRVPLIKLVSSAITIGSGGSGGREGPTAQISAGFGSLLGRWLKLDAHDRRIAVATGIGAGIGAIFRAPLGGAVLAAEILYKDDLEPEAIIPGLVASVVGYTIFGAWAGWTPIFGNQDALGFQQPVQLLYYGLLGIACGLVGVLYSRTFYGVTHMFHRLHLPRAAKPAIGGLLVGLMGLVIPQALGMGYGWVQVGMDQRLLALPLWLVLVIPFAKILATSLSIGSGGSGGIFGPGMVIGGLLGASFWRLTAGFLPGMPPTAAPFVIVAMMALFGGIAHAPLAVMLMVGEMTGNLSLLAPAMIAVGIATWIVGENTIYTSQLPTRADSPAHRLEFSFPLLGTIPVSAAMDAVAVSAALNETVAQVEARLAAAKKKRAPVIENGRMVGIVSLTDIGRIAPVDRDGVCVQKAMTSNPISVAATETLDVALGRLSEARVSWLPVVDSPDSSRVVGELTTAGIIGAYRAQASTGIRELRGVVQG
ncbi:MAG: chloride channel protein [Chloroflexi bacterium]|nr:chloride channel protein [Chloroflexota bacterium]